MITYTCITVREIKKIGKEKKEKLMQNQRKRSKLRATIIEKLNYGDNLNYRE